MIELLETPIGSLVVRLALDLIGVLFVVHGVYLRHHPRREFAFTCYLLNIVTFAMTYLLSGARIEMGVALGLFAVFGILRYRTESLAMRDLTYLFVAIGIAMLNAVAVVGLGLLEVLLIDATILGACAFLEQRTGTAAERTLAIVYDRIDLLAPDRRDALFTDLGTRLGARCARVVVERVDLLKDTAEISVTLATSQSRAP